MLHQLGCLRYSPPLESHIRALKPIPTGSTWEIEIRGTSIWCVELIKREIEKQHPEAKTGGKTLAQKKESDASEESDKPTDNEDKPAKTYGINAILIDFFLYDTMKSLEAGHSETIPHHRTRSIWY